MKRLAPPLLLTAALAGALLGAFSGQSYLEAGFPLLFADALRLGVDALVAAALGFLLAFALLEGLAGRWLSPRLGRALAVALAAAPWFAAAGWRANRAWGIRPRELFEPYSLARNLPLAAAMAAIFLVLLWAVARRRAGAPVSGRGRPLLAGLAVVVLGGNLAVLAAFRSRAADTPETPILVVLVDALRADHVSAYGYPRATTPAIDRLARDGVLFRQAVSASTFTKSSIASLFTGRFPFQHGVYWGGTRGPAGEVRADLLPEGETTLAEALRAGGYLTAAWVQNSHLLAAMGFGQGFVEYHDQQGSASRINHRVSAWLGRAGRRYGFFAYLHYIDLHDPYRPPAPYDRLFDRGGGDPYAGVDLARWGEFLDAVRRGERLLPVEQVAALAALYDGQLRAVDDQVGRLLARLAALGLYDGSLIVLTADHGDGFAEHGFISHSTTPYEELVRVPLIVKLPGGRHAGRIVEEQVRLVDLMPTLLQAVGRPVPVGVAGCTLLALLEDPPGERPAGCAEAVIEIAEEGAYPVAAVRAGGFKYIHHEKKGDEFYDLASDPGERVNRVEQLGAPGERLRRLALAVVAGRAAARAQQIELDERTIRELKALGYVR